MIAFFDVRRLVSAAFALALLGGCQNGAQTMGSGSLLPVALGPQGSHDLLYASSLSGVVSVYTYPKGTFVGTLTDALGSGGLCSDKAGNVYVPSPEGLQITIFAHAGIFPIATLIDETAEPYGCAVNPASGDLAVTSLTGAVQVYPKGRGTPADYSSAGINEFFFCTYDGAGNLFAGGELADGSFALAELPAGKQTLQRIAVDATIAAEYAVAWNGKDLLLQSADASGSATILTVKVSGSTGTVVRTTTLTAPANSFPAQFWLQGGTLIEPDNRNAGVGFWRYPAGGDPIRTFTVPRLELLGVTVSR